MNSKAAQINIAPRYVPLFKDPSRYFIVVGGRGSGKSFAVAVFLLNLTFEKNTKALFTRYTMSAANTSIIPEFIEKIELMGYNDLFRITKDEIINLHTGSSILFKGIRTSSGNQTAALKSLNNISVFCVDEAEELTDEATFDKIDFSVRTQNKQNRCILILNPTSKEHWIYKRFYETRGVPENYNGIIEDTTYVHTTYKDNVDNLSESFLKQINVMKRERPDKYMHQMLGSWLSKAEGVIIKNWRVGEYQQTELTVFAQDFGFSKDLTTLVQLSVDSETKRLWVRECFGEAQLTTSDIAFKNRQFCGTDLIIADSSESRLITELKKLDINVKPAVKKKGSILSGIALMQDYQIIVDKQSHGIMKEFNNYVWRDRGGVVPVDNYNHFVDAIRYGLEYLVRGKSLGKYVVR